jgi:hypothetical protein
MVVIRRDSHIFHTIGSQMTVRLSAPRAGNPLSPGRFLVLISVRGWVDPRGIVPLEGLGQLKYSMTSGFEPATFQLVAPNEVIGFFNWPNPFSRTLALGSTQPLIEMSTRNLPGGKGPPARKTGKLTSI